MLRDRFRCLITIVSFKHNHRWSKQAYIVHDYARYNPEDRLLEPIRGQGLKQAPWMSLKPCVKQHRLTYITVTFFLIHKNFFQATDIRVIKGLEDRDFAIKHV